MPRKADNSRRLIGPGPGRMGAGTLSRLAGLAPSRRAFTLMEIVVAVAAVALVSVGLATIFDSVGKTVTSGRRVSNLNTYAGLMESQMRRDFDAMSRDGFLVIRQQWVDTDNDGLHRTAAVDKVPVSDADGAPRPRRIDEILFFVNGHFTSARQALVPSVQASSGVAEVYYGHGQTSVPLTAASPNFPNYRKPFPHLNDRNNDPTARLGIAPTTGASDGNPNYYAGNWTLLRHLTLLTQPGTADASPVPSNVASVFGIDPTTVAGHAILADKTTQIALQPAASSVFRSVSSYYPVGDNTLRKVSDPTGGPFIPFIASGLIDVAATDLAEVRATVTSGGAAPNIAIFPNLINNANQLPLLSARAFVPAMQNVNGAFARRRPAAYNDLDRMQAWMSDAFPTESRNQQAATAARDILKDPLDTVWGTRMRYEPESTDLLRSVSFLRDGTSIPPNPADPVPLQIAEDRADQLILGSGNLVPHCSEFIVEWSFGNVDAAGQVVWHGPNRTNTNGVTLVASPYPWDSNHIERAKDTTVEFVPATNPALPIILTAHRTTDRLIYGFSPVGDEACLTSYFGWTDPTFDPTPPANYAPAAQVSWPWPRMIRVTVTLADPLDPTIESTFQYIFTTPADPK